MIHRRLSAFRLIFAMLVLIVSSIDGLAATPAHPKEVQITLLHVNDVYQISPVDKGTRGGLARVAMIRKQSASESPNVLLFLSGDTISPSVASSIFRGRQMIDCWNAVGVDYACLGNHEFDFGPGILQERVKESHFVWLNANVIDRKTKKPFGSMPPYVIRDIAGIKIGLFGLLTTSTEKSSKPGPDVGFLDPIATAVQAVREMKAKGARIIIAITHLSMDEDKSLAHAVPSIDLIFGGHEHTILRSLVGHTPIFKAGSDARDVDKIVLHVNSATGAISSLDWRLLPVTPDVPEEPETAAVVSRYEKELSAQLDQPVGRTGVALDAGSAANRGGETNLADFICDAYRQSMSADVAIVNGGSIRSNMSYGPGTLTRRDLLSILPFEDPVVKVAVTGSVIRAALEHGLDRISETREDGRFPQVSGIRYAFDSQQPAGKRIVDVNINGQPLDDARTYSLALTIYLANGGDGYTMFAGATFLTSAIEGPAQAVVLLNAVNAVPEIHPEVDGRIQEIKKNP